MNCGRKESLVTTVQEDILEERYHIHITLIEIITIVLLLLFLSLTVPNL
jgi:hypothetical protein